MRRYHLLGRLGILIVPMIATGVGWSYWAGKDAGTNADALRSGKAERRTDKTGLGGTNRPTSVAVAKAKAMDIRIVQTALGTVVSRASVVVRSRVSGQLIRVLFKEGQPVKADDLLAEIDPRPFQFALRQVQGQLARDQSLLENAKLDLERLKTLKAKGYLAKQTVDAQESLVRQYQGALLADQALVDNAKLQLEFTRITAPISGRIGLRQVDAGNNINANDAGGLAVINEVQPISVVFSIPEDVAPEVLMRLDEAQRSGGALQVEAWDRGGKHLLATGTLLSADNQIDTASGTIKLKAQFPNPDLVLVHNQFVNIRMLLDTRHEVTAVPNAAIQRGSLGTFVYAVSTDKTVAVRPVTLGPIDGDYVAVDEGIVPGELVVVNGADKLRAGAKVDVTMEDPQPASDRNPADSRNKPTRARPDRSNAAAGDLQVPAPLRSGG